MTSSEHDEQLSAFLDGELSSVDAARIATIVEELGGAEQVDHWREIGRRLRDVPVGSLGPDFASRVTAAIAAQKASPLQASRSDSSDAGDKSQSSSDVRKRWSVASRKTLWVGLAAAAACIGLIATWATLDFGRPPVDTLANSGEAGGGKAKAKFAPKLDPGTLDPGTLDPGTLDPGTLDPGTLATDSARPQLKPDDFPSGHEDAVDPGSIAANSPPGTGTGAATGRLPKSPANNNMVVETPSVSPGQGAKYLFVFEIGVNAQGVQTSVVDRVLKQAGVNYDPSIDVAKPLEKTLLDSRFLKGLVMADPEKIDQRPKRSRVQLIYIVARGQQLDATWKELLVRSDEVNRVRANMAIMPDEIRVFRELRVASEAELASVNRTPQANRAHRVLTQMALFTQPGRGLASLLSTKASTARQPSVKVKSGLPATSKKKASEEPAKKEPAKAKAAKKRQAGGFNMSPEMMEQLFGPNGVSEILLIVHTPG